MAADTPLRIAQVAPLYESVPPRLYGGTERVVSYLTEELVRLGHEVTLFASGDSITAAQLESTWDTALRLDERAPAEVALHLLQLQQVFASAGRFDVIHCHTELLHLPFARNCPVPVLTTLHGRLDLAGLPEFFREYHEQPVVSISDAQRAPLPAANWSGTVHHGLPTDLLLPGAGRGGYLAFVGRISPEKRVDRAIEIARRAGMPLKIAAKIAPADREYFEARIAPLLATPAIEYLGEVSENEKEELLGEALALLFPIDWPEPFGLVLIEAMACGTPVIAWPHGSVPELVAPGVTGFIVGSIAEAVQAVDAVPALDRQRIRAVFARRFSAGRMAREYCALYARCREWRWQRTA